MGCWPGPLNVMRSSPADPAGQGNPTGPRAPALPEPCPPREILAGDRHTTAHWPPDTYLKIACNKSRPATGDCVPRPVGRRSGGPGLPAFHRGNSPQSSHRAGRCPRILTERRDGWLADALPAIVDERLGAHVERVARARPWRKLVAQSV